MTGEVVIYDDESLYVDQMKPQPSQLPAHGVRITSNDRDGLSIVIQCRSAEEAEALCADLKQALRRYAR